MEPVYIDLHIHTSDDPENLNDAYDLCLLKDKIEEFAEGSVYLISLTDHNTVNKSIYLKAVQQFEHMLTAFTYGVTPHGGIAPGIDRFLFTVLGEPSIREMMAFPTSASGQTSVMDAPSEVQPQQLKELGVAILNRSHKNAQNS